MNTIYFCKFNSLIINSIIAFSALIIINKISKMDSTAIAERTPLFTFSSFNAHALSKNNIDKAAEILTYGFCKLNPLG